MIRSRNNDSAIADAGKNQKVPTLSAYTSQKPPPPTPTKKPQSIEDQGLEDGSGGWDRTNDLVINSHPLCR
jgi:hypothetical protein